MKKVKENPGGWDTLQAKVDNLLSNVSKNVVTLDAFLQNYPSVQDELDEERKLFDKIKQLFSNLTSTKELAIRKCKEAVNQYISAQQRLAQDRGNKVYQKALQSGPGAAGGPTGGAEAREMAQKKGDKDKGL